MRKILFSGGILLIIGALSFYVQLSLPRPTGPHPVGRAVLRWIDQARPEGLTPAPADRREVVAEVWYPAEPGTGTRAPYLLNLPRVAGDLAASGEVSPFEVFGLRWIRSGAFLDAAVSSAELNYPVVILSPGNGTNVEFYSALASELASQGYMVFGLNHPYDVAAVALRSGEVARFDAQAWPLDMQARQAFVRARIGVRVEDALFVLDRLEVLNGEQGEPFAGRLKLDQVGIMGHSLGGIAAAQACAVDTRLKSCLNLDGLQAGGPFSASPDPRLPAQPFMLITKEARLHPATLALFEKLPAPGFLVQIAGATHAAFTDGPLLLPSLLPIPNRADRNTAVIRSYLLAFFDQTLKGKPASLLTQAHPPSQAVVTIFP